MFFYLIRLERKKARKLTEDQILMQKEKVGIEGCISAIKQNGETFLKGTLKILNSFRFATYCKDCSRIPTQLTSSFPLLLASYINVFYLSLLMNQYLCYLLVTNFYPYFI